MKSTRKRKSIFIKAFLKIFLYFIVMALIAGLVFYFEDDFSSIFKTLEKQISPCSEPITYSLGDFDSRFGLSREEFLKAIKQATQIWSRGADRPLFAHAETGGLKIHLVYDERQDSTIKLKNLGLDISKSKANYETLRAKYDALSKTYNAEKAKLDEMAAYFNQEKENYEAEVKAANRRGVTPEEFVILETERNALNGLVASLKQKEEAINKIVDELNALANVINRLIYDLNLDVENYNTIGSSSTGEFQEGVFSSDVLGERIIIYQFDDEAALVRVLTHELGHALGLEHVDEAKAIMYRLNESGGDSLAADDLAQLKMVCEIK